MVRLWHTVQELICSLDGDASANARVKSSPARSMQLLVENLSPTQRAQYERCKYFEVIGGDTGSRYRIRRGRVLNVELLDNNGRRTTVLCFMPEGQLPMGDVMLAQKLALELFEAQAIRVAHRAHILDPRLAGDLRLRYRLRR